QVDDITGSTLSFTLDGIIEANIKGFSNAYGINLGLNNSVDLLSVTNSIWNVSTTNSANTKSGYGIRAPAISALAAIISNTKFSISSSGSLFNNSYGIYLGSNLDNSQISLTGNTITAKGIDSAYGIYVDTNGKESCSILVDGLKTASITANSSGNASGIYLVPSPSGTTTARIQNIKELNVTSSAEKAYGINIFCQDGANPSTTIESISSMTVTSSESIAYGIYIEGSETTYASLSYSNNLTSENKINALGSAYGIYIDPVILVDNLSITNNTWDLTSKSSSVYGITAPIGKTTLISNEIFACTFVASSKVIDLASNQTVEQISISSNTVYFLYNNIEYM
ncbi:MAG: hypothetical protein EB127_31965, partial [Alphaproteobacteria bacterium]|nr:hypothetical protein [Alphaproteobacteria bacterium]